VYDLGRRCRGWGSVTRLQREINDVVSALEPTRASSGSPARWPHEAVQERIESMNITYEPDAQAEHQDQPDALTGVASTTSPASGSLARRSKSASTRFPPTDPDHRRRVSSGDVAFGDAPEAGGLPSKRVP